MKKLHREEVIEKLAEQYVENMDLETALAVAYDHEYEYLKELVDSDLVTQYEEEFEETITIED